MDFTSLNTKKGAAKGAFLHLKHPALGHKLYTGEGASGLGELVDADKADKVGVSVLGMESERVRNRAKEISRKRMKDGENEATDEDGVIFVCSLVTEFHGIEKDGKPMAATEENKRAFFEQSDALVEQVLNFAQDRANFFKAE